MRKNISLKSVKSLIELEPLGLAPSTEVSRPLMLFKEIEGNRVLPVWVSHLDAGIALVQNNSYSKSPSPHEFLKELLETLEIQLVSCTFEDVVGHHQFVTLRLKGSRKVKELKTRADHVISLCMHAGCRFFTSVQVLKKSQDVEAEMNETAVKLKTAPLLLKNPHPYLN
jgi:uncharacterized protein